MGGAETPGEKAPNKIWPGYQKIQDLISCGEREEAKAALEASRWLFEDVLVTHFAPGACR